MRWTSLPARKDFTPLVMQLANHVARRPPVDAPSVVLADGTAEFTVNGLWGDVKAEVKTPSGRVVEQPFERSGPRLLGSFTETSERGYYTLNVKSKKLEQGKAGDTAFAVNLSPEESDFTMVGEDQLHELLPSAKLTYVDASTDTKAVRDLVTDEKSEVGRGWWVALLLASDGERVLHGDVGRPAEEGGGGGAGDGAGESGAGGVVGGRHGGARAK